MQKNWEIVSKRNLNTPRTHPNILSKLNKGSSQTPLHIKRLLRSVNTTRVTHKKFNATSSTGLLNWQHVKEANASCQRGNKLSNRDILTR